VRKAWIIGDGGRTPLRRMRYGRSLACLAVVLTSTSLLALLFASTASAYIDPPVKLALEPENLELAESLLLEDSPRKVPGVEPTVEAQRGYKDLVEPPPDESPTVEADLGSTEVPDLLAKTSVWDWDYLPPLTVALAGFWAGWEIGSTVWGAFFGESEPKIENVAYEATEWVPGPPGWRLLSGPGGDIYSPDWGFRGHNGSTYNGTMTDTGECETELYGEGERLYEPAWWATNWTCANYELNYALWKPMKVVNCGVGAYLCPGIEPVPMTSKYENYQPTAPTSEEFKEHVKEALETSEYTVFNRWFNYLVQPENYPDPRVTEKKVDDEERRCDRGTPLFENPGGNKSPEPFAKKEELSFTVANPPEGFRESGPVYLRWGTTDWEPNRENYKEPLPYLDLWGGWGYRHIAAKHGWNAVDRAETEATLATALPKPTSKPSKFTYESPDMEGGIESVACVRKVVVDFEAGEGDPSPRGIVSSYNIVK
jgi:hypothetical protein